MRSIAVKSAAKKSTQLYEKKGKDQKSWKDVSSTQSLSGDNGIPLGMYIVDGCPACTRKADSLIRKCVGCTQWVKVTVPDSSREIFEAKVQVDKEMIASKIAEISSKLAESRKMISVDPSKRIEDLINQKTSESLSEAAALMASLESVDEKNEYSAIADTHSLSKQLERLEAARISGFMTIGVSRKSRKAGHFMEVPNDEDSQRLAREILKCTCQASDQLKGGFGNPLAKPTAFENASASRPYVIDDVYFGRPEKEDSSFFNFFTAVSMLTFIRFLGTYATSLAHMSMSALIMGGLGMEKRVEDMRATGTWHDDIPVTFVDFIKNLTGFPNMSAFSDFPPQLISFCKSAFKDVERSLDQLIIAFNSKLIAKNVRDLLTLKKENQLKVMKLCGYLDYDKFIMTIRNYHDNQMDSWALDAIFSPMSLKDHWEAHVPKEALTWYDPLVHMHLVYPVQNKRANRLSLITTLFECSFFPISEILEMVEKKLVQHTADADKLIESALSAKLRGMFRTWGYSYQTDGEKIQMEKIASEMEKYVKNFYQVLKAGKRMRKVFVAACQTNLSVVQSLVNAQRVEMSQLNKITKEDSPASFLCRLNNITYFPEAMSIPDKYFSSIGILQKYIRTLLKTRNGAPLDVKIKAVLKGEVSKENFQEYLSPKKQSRPNRPPVGDVNPSNNKKRDKTGKRGTNKPKSDKPAPTKPKKEDKPQSDRPRKEKGSPPKWFQEWLQSQSPQGGPGQVPFSPMPMLGGYPNAMGNFPHGFGYR